MTPEETQVLMSIASRIGSIEQGLADLKKELLDNGQPGFINKTRDRLTALERDNARRGWIEHSVSAVLAAIVAAAVSTHDHWLGWLHK